jgi:hypothetical protein
MRPASRSPNRHVYHELSAPQHQPLLAIRQLRHCRHRQFEASASKMGYFTARQLGLNAVSRSGPFFADLPASASVLLCTWRSMFAACTIVGKSATALLPCRMVTNRVVWLVEIHNDHLPCGYLGVNTMQISGESRTPCNAPPSHPFLQGRTMIPGGCCRTKLYEIRCVVTF